MFTRIVVIVGLLCVPVMLAPHASAADPVLVGAGDIAVCGSTDDEATARLLDGIEGTVFTTGDSVYEKGTAVEFANCYEPSWGRHKARTRPAPGNHDYYTTGASGYYNYYGTTAGDPSKGYYSYDLGAWHVVVINSNCTQVGGCGANSAQEQWLRADLQAHPTTCSLAYWHHPRFSSGYHRNTVEMQPIWQALYDAGADVVLNGHDHHYERFAPQTASGVRDDERGMREFVVGTGGVALRAIGTVQPNSEVRNSDTHGVLKLTLHSTSYDWEFVPEAGKTFTDKGTAACVTNTGLSPNLLKNGGFEADANNDTAPDNWLKHPNFTRSSATHYAGSYAGRHSATNNASYAVGQVVPAVAGTTYAFGCRANIPATSDAFTFKFQVQWRDASNSTIGTTTLKTYSAPTNDWNEATGIVMAPAGTAKAAVRMVVRSLNGTVYVDACAFRAQ